MSTLQPPDIRVGYGFDFHPFATDRELILGGVPILCDVGLQGHSDADALCHAISDALLGAAGLKDIGTYFPDSNPAYQGISSLLLLEKVFRLIRGNHFDICNIDSTILAEKPRIQPYVEAIKANLGRVIQLPPDRIGIKATTMEGKGPIGRQEGIAVQAVALLLRSTT